MQKGDSAYALTFIFITVLLDVIGWGIIIPVLPELIMELSTANLSQASIYAGWLMFAYSFMVFIFGPIVGGLSDHYGRRPILLGCLAGFTIDFLVQGLAPTLAWLFLGRVLAGVFGATPTVANAYIADISPPEKRAQNFGLIGVAFGLGFIIGPAIGGFLGEYGVRIPFFAAAAFAGINMIFGYFVLPESLSAENQRPFQIKRANPIRSLQNLLKREFIGQLIIVYFFMYLAHFSLQATWSYYTMEKFQWTAWDIGLSLSVVGVMVAFVQGYLTRVIIPKFGLTKTALIGLSFGVLEYLLFALAPNGTWMYIFIVITALSGILGPALQGILSRLTPNNAQGELQGGLVSVSSIAAIFGPLVMTGVFSYYTSDKSSIYLPGAPFYLALVLILLALFLALPTLRQISFEDEAHIKT